MALHSSYSYFLKNQVNCVKIVTGNRESPLFVILPELILDSKTPEDGFLGFVTDASQIGKRVNTASVNSIPSWRENYCSITHTF